MLYKYCTTDGFDILLRHRLKAARRENFNDPFELALGVDDKNATGNVKRECKKNPSLVDGLARELDKTKVGHENSENDIINKSASILTEELEKGVSAVREYLKGKGIICLSESADIIQMWAHYTDNHKGLVIGLDENQVTGNEMELINKVCYRDEICLLPVTSLKEGTVQYEEIIYDVLKTKESNWKYEREVRLYVNLDEKDADGNYYVDIPPSSITEIYLGLRSHETSEIIAISIKQREEYNHLKIYKMERDRYAFKLVPKEL